MIAVTTFPKWGWGVYAEACVRSWVSKWPGAILAYFEGDAPPSRMPGVAFRSLDEVEDRKAFLKNEFPTPMTYLHDTERFSHKVFAQLDALKDNDEVWWLDADVEAKYAIPEDLLVRLNAKSFVTFLGRDTYTETGVIGFNRNDEGFLDFETRYRDAYMSGKIFNFKMRTDCHAFDYARQRKGHNLTPNGMGVENVLEQSPLGTYLVHHKGNRKLKIERSSHAV